MDKHTRPYRCRDSNCQKLPGFTYSGGLLRHQREVHKQWGGPKKRMFCPYPDCKRHTGEGFSRQENLQEHKRRVHKEAPLEVDSTRFTVKTEPTSELESAADTPLSVGPEASETKHYAVGKRRCVEHYDSGEQGPDGEQMWEQIKRIRTENAELQKQMAEMTKRLAQMEREQTMRCMTT